MKNKKIKELIMEPLRFHHQDVHQELNELKDMVRDLNIQMQELRHQLAVSSNEDIKDSGMELYEHPWYKYKREQLISAGNYK
jgi:hypothetical protein